MQSLKDISDQMHEASCNKSDFAVLEAIKQYAESRGGKYQPSFKDNVLFVKVSLPPFQDIDELFWIAKKRFKNTFRTSKVNGINIYLL